MLRYNVNCAKISYMILGPDFDVRLSWHPCECILVVFFSTCRERERRWHRDTGRLGERTSGPRQLQQSRKQNFDCFNI